MSATPRAAPAADALAAGLLRGEARALARAISAVENGAPGAPALLRAVQPHTGRALVVGFTGPPGVGKSTLVSAYVGVLRAAARTVGVVAIDPSSPISGGAILGDRIRMAAHASDAGVYVRSLASRGSGGGLSLAAARAVDLIDAAGRDVVVVETVGSGQAEVDVTDVVDVTVVVCAPGLGDGVQAIKAGILEIADVLAVNKSDHPGAQATRRELRAMLGLRADRGAGIEVVATTATTGEGVAALAEAVTRAAERARAAGRPPRARRGMRRLLASAAARLLAERLRSSDDAAVDAICDAVRCGEIDIRGAARALLDGGTSGDG